MDDNDNDNDNIHVYMSSPQKSMTGRGAVPKSSDHFPQARDMVRQALATTGISEGDLNFMSMDFESLVFEVCLSTIVPSIEDLMICHPAQQ